MFFVTDDNNSFLQRERRLPLLLLSLPFSTFSLAVAVDDESRNEKRKKGFVFRYERGPNHIFERQVTVFFFKFFLF